MSNMKFAPLRPLNDFLLDSARFQLPNFSDLERWNKRVENNLVYYQTNYFLVAIIMFLVVGICNPGQMLLGLVTVIGMLFLYRYLAQHQAVVQGLKRKHPFLCLIAVFAAGYLIIHLIGSVLVFLFGIVLPILAVFIHASLRLRNMTNKVANELEKLGVKQTPMGILLDELGMIFEHIKE